MYIYIYVFTDYCILQAHSKGPYSFSLNRYWELVAKRITERVSIGDQASSLHASYYTRLFLSRTFLGSIRTLFF